METLLLVCIAGAVLSGCLLFNGVHIVLPRDLMGKTIYSGSKRNFFFHKEHVHWLTGTSA
jgi:hypothetical protein